MSETIQKSDYNVIDDAVLTSKQTETIEDIKDQAFHAGYEQRQEELDAVANFPKKIIRELRELPELIQASSYELLRLTCNIEIERRKIADCKDDASNIILGILESGKPKYSNDKARDAAVKIWLRENAEYRTSVDELARLEYMQRKQQIDLMFYENKFQACRSIAILRGVKP